MRLFADWIRWQTLSGLTVRAGDFTLTPIARSLMVRLPSGGLVWSWPLAVDVQRGGERRRLPIVDVTRLAMLALLGVALTFIIRSTLNSRTRSTPNG